MALCQVHMLYGRHHTELKNSLESVRGNQLHYKKWATMLDLGVRVQTTITVCKIKKGSGPHSWPQASDISHSKETTQMLGAVIPSPISSFWDYIEC